MRISLAAYFRNVRRRKIETLEVEQEGEREVLKRREQRGERRGKWEKKLGEKTNLQSGILDETESL